MNITRGGFCFVSNSFFRNSYRSFTTLTRRYTLKEFQSLLTDDEKVFYVCKYHIDKLSEQNGLTFEPSATLKDQLEVLQNKGIVRSDESDCLTYDLPSIVIKSAIKIETLDENVDELIDTPEKKYHSSNNFHDILPCTKKSCNIADRMGIKMVVKKDDFLKKNNLVIVQGSTNAQLPIDCFVTAKSRGIKLSGIVGLDYAISSMQYGRATAQSVGIADHELQMFQANALKLRYWRQFYPDTSGIKFLSLLPPVLSAQENLEALILTSQMMEEGDEFISAIYLADREHSSHYRDACKLADRVKESEEFVETFTEIPKKNILLINQTFAKSVDSYQKLLYKAQLSLIEKFVVNDGKRIAVIYRATKNNSPFYNV